VTDSIETPASRPKANYKMLIVKVLLYYGIVAVLLVTGANDMFELSPLERKRKTEAEQPQIKLIKNSGEFLSHYLVTCFICFI